MTPKQTLGTISKAALGIGFLAGAIELYFEARERAAGVGGLGKLDASPGTRGVRKDGRSPTPALGKPTAQHHQVWNIDKRVELIRKLIVKGHLNPVLHEKTVEILSQKCGKKYCVPEKDCEAEVKWLFNAIRNPSSKYSVRYTRDMLLADTFTQAERTLLQTKGGDCDDYTILLGAMLMSVGHPVRVRVVAAKNEANNNAWSHVYLITMRRFDDPSAGWMAVDCSVAGKTAGWEAPGAAESALSGKPAGMIHKVKDFPVP